MTGGPVSGSVRDRSEIRLLPVADFRGLPTARGEGATGQLRTQVGRQAVDGGEPAGGRVGRGVEASSAAV